MENKLPKNWIECALSELLIKLENGTRPKGGVRGIKEGVPSVGGEHLNNYGGFNVSNVKFVPVEFANKMNRGQIRLNDILIVKDGATTGKVAYVDKDFPYDLAFVNEHVFICRPSTEVNPKYIFWYLWSDEGNKRVLENFKGSAQGGINTTFAPNTFIALAPIAEQSRIVSKIDLLMGKYYKSQFQINKIPALLKRFRHSILDQAVSGLLIGNNDNGWTESFLKDVILESPKNGYSAKPVNYETKNKVITLTATTSGIFNSKHFKYFDEEISPKSHFWIRPNDILVQRGNALEYVGVSAIYDGEPNQFIYPDLMIKIRANEEIVTTKFLYFLLSAEGSRDFLRSNATGTSGNMPKINQPTLLSLKIKYPSIKEQIEIVTKAEELLSIADNFDIQFQKISSYFDKIPSSILSKAFTGKLNTNVPTDISPSGVLEQIKLEKQLIKSEPKKIKNIRKDKKVIMKNNILEIIKERFKNESFTFQQLQDEVKMNYEDISKNILNLVSSENLSSELIMSFNLEKNIIEFKRKS